MSRVVALWLPDWPVQAAVLAGVLDTAPPAPVALCDDTGITAASAAARRIGVRRGQSRRHAQALCPELALASTDRVRDAAEFEPVLTRVEAVAAGVEALRPGLLVLAARGVARYYGGEAQALEKLADAAAVPGVDCVVGIADDIITAILAARRGALVPAGAGEQFRAGVSLAELRAEESLGLPEALAQTWRDLGLRTLGDVAALPKSSVASRFGAEGAYWHDVACHGQARLVAPRSVPLDLSVEHEAWQEPLQRVDQASFIARALAATLHESLVVHGLSCYRLAIEAQFSDGTQARRLWRCAQPLSERTTADRVRWQLDGWLNRRSVAGGGIGRADTAGAVPGATGGGGVAEAELSPDALPATPPVTLPVTPPVTLPGAPPEVGADYEHEAHGIVLLRLEPVEVVAAGSIKDDLWQGSDSAQARARRAAERVQGLLGPSAVTQPVLRGGRGPTERIEFVPFGEEPSPTRQQKPWPGVIPAPNPAVISHPSSRVELLDAAGQPVGVTGRATVTAAPSTLRRGGENYHVVSWAGPWPIDERWWVPDEGRRAARMQVMARSASGRAIAVLLVGHAGKWRIEGSYD